jgi:hypothetical protein
MQRFNITVQAQHNGTACQAVHGQVRPIACSNFMPCPIDCQGTWQVAESCNASCNNGTGFVTGKFNITVPAQHGGADCPATNGEERFVNCTNSQPCPVDCEGTWEEFTPCNATCNNGTGFALDRSNVAVQAQYNGTECKAPHGAEREHSCTNEVPCPINCEAAWEVSMPCNASCGNGTGVITELFVVAVEGQHNGTTCEAANGTYRFPSCSNSEPCPLDCTGAWMPEAACNASCGNGAGFRSEYFNVVGEAQYNGTCEALNGTLRFLACNNSEPCLVDCVGAWEVAAACNATCGNGTGFLT